ncbi:Calcineurin-like phosphoesterase [Croceitalea dokdonensis DOKDO 023]|uniref:Calcineurin-like phosphoesterase n=2 Tax=Croceitalea TaxID=574891 RepID=A0A0P7AW04_9FLAO|nr:Calcineurin-like phosphoesterase [Croceitalea dokdonensis DOKDO 023]
MNVVYKAFLCFPVVFLFGLVSNAQLQPILGETKIAFMADVHFLDVHGTLGDVGYKGILNPRDSTYSLIRSMDAQLHSTRLFNENYFSFKAALDDAVKRGIKIIVLPGDFSDDGQPINIRGLKTVLNRYSREYGLSFFLTTGNHDPTRPFGDKGGKVDFLGEGGKAQPIMSQQGMFNANRKKEHPVIISKEVREMGYEEIVNELDLHGFFPKSVYRYWETPFSDYTYEEYSLEKATAASLLKNRWYQQGSNATPLPDVSYLVEPIEGVWLLALDANVYLPKTNPSEYHGAGIGYNQVLKHKQHLVHWTREVAKEAKRLDKTLIAFSHYPMVDFNDGATEEMKLLFGENGLQVHRVPDQQVAEVFADAGLKIHFGGHMHLNDIGVHTSVNGNTLTNVQVPSLAVYKPAYTFIKLKNNGVLKLKTVVLDTVPDFDSFFKLYQEEHKYLKSLGDQQLWKTEILASKDYKTFTQWHLKELIRLRLLKEWPEKLRKLLLNLNGAQLYVLLHSSIPLSDSDFDDNLKSLAKTAVWKKAREAAENRLQKNGLRLQDFLAWDGNDLIYDFYRIRMADSLAFEDISNERIQQYASFFKEKEVLHNNPYLRELELFFIIFSKSM